MFQSTSVETAASVVPNVRSSSGHERMSVVINQLLYGVGLDVETLNLSGGQLLWSCIDHGKRLYKAAYPYGLEFDATTSGGETYEGLRKSLIGLVGNGINNVVERVRSSKAFNSQLLQPYLFELGGNGYKSVFSSHYMAFHELQDNQRGYYFIPDYHLHRSSVEKLTGNPNISFISPFINGTAELIKMGVDESRIFIGFPGVELFRKSTMHDPVIDNSQRLLITIGSDGPEIDYLVENLGVLKERGYNLTVLCGPGEINGQKIRSHLRFRRACEKLLDSQDDEIFGGHDNWSRHQDTKKLVELIQKEEFTAVLSRPNEIPLLANIFGVPNILLPHFQHHEGFARRAMLQTNAALSIDEFLNNPKSIEQLNGEGKIFHPLRKASEFAEYIKASS